MNTYNNIKFLVFLTGLFTNSLLIITTSYSQTCPTSLTDFKVNGGANKFCVVFSSYPGVNTVMIGSVTLTRSGTSNLYTNNFNCNGSVSFPTSLDITVGSLTCTYESGFLPISLISFKGIELNSSIKLQWTTASEVNNEYFAIERSNDAIHFETIGVEPGAGKFK